LIAGDHLGSSVMERLGKSVPVLGMAMVLVLVLVLVSQH
jgi:hypothetical protein